MVIFVHRHENWKNWMNWQSAAQIHLPTCSAVVTLTDKTVLSPGSSEEEVCSAVFRVKRRSVAIVQNKQ